MVIALSHVRDRMMFVINNVTSSDLYAVVAGDGSGVRRWTGSAYSHEDHNKNMPAIIASNTSKKFQNFDTMLNYGLK